MKGIEISKRKKHSKQRTLKDNKSKPSVSRTVGGRLRMFGKLFMVILTLWVGHVTLKPRIDVRPIDAYDPSNPATTSFIIKNQGYVSIYNVVPSTPMKEIKLSGDITIRAQVPFANDFSITEDVAKVIAPGKEHTINLFFRHMKNNRMKE